VRVRRLILVPVAIAGLLGVIRRRRTAEFVEVEFEDGAAVRLTTGVEARDLLDDAHAIVQTAA
jgi:hypothetical protein